MISVVHVISSLDTGGAERMLVKLLEGLDRSRFDPVVVSLTDEGTQGAVIRVLDIPVHTLNMRPSWTSPGALLRLRRMLRAIDPDIVHGWMYHGGLAALIAKGRARAVVGIRQSLYDIRDEKPGTRVVIRALGRIAYKADCLVYNSVVGAKQHESLGYPANIRLIIPNGFDSKIFQPDPGKGKRIRAELGIGDGWSVIGHVARFHPVKDHAGFLGAAALVAKTHTKACFVLAGPGVESNNPAFAGTMQDPLLKGRVFLLGERSDTSALYNTMDVFCSSSFSEGFPNVVGEAMACGIPCVVTDVGDSAHAVGDTGRVVPPRNSIAMAAACRDLLDMDRKDRENLGQAARKRVIEHFSLESVVCRYVALFQDVIEKSRAGTRSDRGGE